MFLEAIKLLFRTIGYYYSINPLLVVTKESAHVVRTGINIYSIFIAGKFIDGTVFVLTQWDTFSFREYIATDSFFYLLLGLILFCVARLLTGLSTYLTVILDSEFYFKEDLDILKKFLLPICKK